VRRLLAKMRGAGVGVPARPEARIIVVAAVGATLAIGAMAALTRTASVAILLGSFGSSCALVFGYPETAFSQPRNVIGGHLLSSATGLVFLWAFGPQWWAVALAVGAAVLLMMIARVIHPPAASNPVIVFLSQPGWSFLWFPTLTGAVVLVLVALVFNNAVNEQKYPRYW
jgi:CBS-domain-containing membrane protein